MWTMSTVECGSSPKETGCRSGNAPDGGVSCGAELGSGAGLEGKICGLTDRSDGDWPEIASEVEYWQSRWTVVQLMHCGRVSSHCHVSRFHEAISCHGERDPTLTVRIAPSQPAFSIIDNQAKKEKEKRKLTVSLLAFEAPVPGFPVASAHHLAGLLVFR